MRGWLEGRRGFLLGFLTALVSAIVVLGSFVLALTEGGTRIALLPSPTFTSSPTATQTSTPTPPPPPATALPGAPTFTPSPIPTATPLPTATPAFPLVSNDCPATPPDWKKITVEFGATLVSIAGQYGIDAAELAGANCLPPDYSGSLLANTDLYVPASLPTATSPPTATPKSTRRWCASRPPSSWIPYTVKRGENLFRIGLRYGVNTSVLQYYNCIADPDKIYAGQVIYVPNVPTITPTPTDTQPPTNTPTSPPPTSTPTSPPPTTAVPTSTPTPTFTSTPTPTTGPSPTPTATFTPTSTPTPSPTATFTPTPSPTATDTPTPTTPTP